MKDRQGNRCVLCGEEKKLVVDHDHKTNAVRALLCTSCNTFVGVAERYVGILGRTAAYVGEVV